MTDTQERVREPLTGPDVARRRDLVRMKMLATGLLLVAAVVYVVADRWEAAGGPAAAGYLRTAAEAAMVGGLADWFAVTALFRRPLGLPIPHTALIRTRKDALGRNLGDFVGVHFLSEQVLRDRLRRADLARRFGGRLAEEAVARRVVTEAAAVVRAGIRLLRDEDVQAVVEHAVRRRLLTTPVGPPLGELLGRVFAQGAHHEMVDVVVRETHAWLRTHREVVMTVVTSQAPDWSPRFVDERVAAKVHSELLRVAGEIAADRHHPARAALDRFLAQFAHDLGHDPDTMAGADRAKHALVDHPDVRSALNALLGAGRRALLDLVDDEEGELRTRALAAVRSLGRRLRTDERLQCKVDGWLEEAAAHVVINYRDELTTVITDTVERWDGAETARKVELAVGRDLQFIRINGTVVGALAGLAIHAVSRLAL